MICSLGYLHYIVTVMALAVLVCSSKLGSLQGINLSETCLITLTCALSLLKNSVNFRHLNSNSQENRQPLCLLGEDLWYAITQWSIL